MGIVEDIVWPEDATSTSELPLAVLVSCPTYTGPTLWHTEDGTLVVPIPVVKSTFDVGGKCVSRTQVPLRLAWGVTIHKSQGLTLPKIKIGLGTSEFAVGLTFVGLSRVKTLSDIMFVEPFDYSRLQRLGGKNLQHRLDDYSRRYPS